MINKYHTDIAMGFVEMWHHNKGKPLTAEEKMKIEKKLIGFSNKWNSIENKIVNNRLSNWIKELFYQLFGVPYPEYLYNEKMNDYVVAYSQGFVPTTLNFKGFSIPFIGFATEISTTPEQKFALNVAKLWVLKRNYIKSMVNKSWKKYGGEGVYRSKRIWEVEKTLGI